MLLLAKAPLDISIKCCYEIREWRFQNTNPRTSLSVSFYISVVRKLKGRRHSPMRTFLVLFLIEVVGSFQENFTDSVVLIFYEMEKLSKYFGE